MTKFGLAQPVRRVEDFRFLVGAGRYTDDIVLPGLLHGIVLRSPHAAARINKVDTTTALSLDGVAAIYTAADLNADGIVPMPCAAPVQNRDGSNMASPPHPALADGAVRHVGDPVAFVLAETAKAARDAAEQITVDYDVLPAITDLVTAIEPGAPQVWPEVKNNLVFDWEVGDKTATDAEFADAAHVTNLTVVNNRVVVASMEARAAIADYDRTSGRWTLYANTQGGWLIKGLLGSVFATEPENFRVITPDVGGGFGMKAFLYAEHVLTCYAARKLERPVKWASERGEAFLADTQGRDNVTLGELAIDKDGIFRALRTRNIANMGAYLSTFAPYIPTFAGGAWLSGVYGFRAIHANVLGVFTHTVPVDAYRGAGAPGNYLLERLIDAAARELKIDRAELRRRNMVPPSAIPHATPVGKTYDSGDFPRYWILHCSGWTTPGSRDAARTRQSAASAAASACRTISRLRWAIPPSARKSGSPRMGSSRSTSAPSPPVRVTKPRTPRSLPTSSASTVTRSASARAIPTPSRAVVVLAARAACIPRAMRSW
jgi:carbon-monoxide dehydrogenase large subunit